MSGLALFQELPDAGVKSFSKDEEKKVMALVIPGELRTKRKWGGGAIYYPKKPVVNVGQWFADHAARLRGLEAAAGM